MTEKPWLAAGREAAADWFVAHASYTTHADEVAERSTIRSGKGDHFTVTEAAIAGSRLGYIAGLRAAMEVNRDLIDGSEDVGDKALSVAASVITALISEAEGGK